MFWVKEKKKRKEKKRKKERKGMIQRKQTRDDQEDLGREEVTSKKTTACQNNSQKHIKAKYKSNSNKNCLCINWSRLPSSLISWYLDFNVVSSAGGIKTTKCRHK